MDAVVVAADAPREEHEQRDQQQRDPCPLAELGHGGDDEDDGRQRGADGVEEHALAPVLVAPAPPVHDHPGLREGEGDEHADGVERDQRARCDREPDEQDRGGDGERDRAVAERQAVSEPQEQARRVPVAGHEGQQAREAVERGVGRQQQHQRGRDLHVDVQRPGPEAAMGQLRERGLAGARDDAVEVHQHDEPGEHRHQQADHQREDGARVARGRRLEGGHGVGDRLDAGHRGRAGGEGAQHQQHGEALDRLERRRPGWA